MEIEGQKQAISLIRPLLHLVTNNDCLEDFFLTNSTSNLPLLKYLFMKSSWQKVRHKQFGFPLTHLISFDVNPYWSFKKYTSSLSSVCFSNKLFPSSSSDKKFPCFLKSNCRCFCYLYYNCAIQE